MARNATPPSRQEAEETFILKARFEYDFSTTFAYGFPVSKEHNGPPDRAIATLALIRWLREGSVDAIHPLRPDLIAGSGALSATPLELVFRSELAAAFLEVLANDIAQRRGWLVIFDQARTSGDKYGVTIEALARVRRPGIDIPPSEKTEPPIEKTGDKRKGVFSLSVLLALGLTAIGPTANAIEQYPKVREGVVSMAEDFKRVALEIVDIFSRLLHLGHATATFEKVSPGVAESFTQST